MIAIVRIGECSAHGNSKSNCSKSLARKDLGTPLFFALTILAPAEIMSNQRGFRKATALKFMNNVNQQHNQKSSHFLCKYYETKGEALELICFLICLVAEKHM